MHRIDEMKIVVSVSISIIPLGISNLNDIIFFVPPFVIVAVLILVLILILSLDIDVDVNVNAKAYKRTNKRINKNEVDKQVFE